MPCSQPAICGDFGISGERPAAPSRTISRAAATRTSPSSEHSAGVSHSERERANARWLCAAMLTKRGCSQRSPHGLGLEIRVEPVAAVLATDPGRLEASDRSGWIDQAPCVDVDRARPQHRGQPVGVAHVARPYAGGETVLAFVGAARDLLE